MFGMRRTILFLSICAIAASFSQITYGVPASSFTLQNGDWYDNFDINRNFYSGPKGFLPNLATESLGENKELAFSIGERFLENYESRIERAVAILKYVQRWTEYGYDSDNVVRNGVAQEEWAWNADEMAHAFNEVTGVEAVGDCEDMAFLCGIICVGAGFDAAIVDAPGHVALVIWLPEYSNADKYWDVPKDGREAGWIWVEVTGESNPLGWTPPDYEDGGWTAYPIGDLDFVPAPQPESSDTTLIPSIDIDLDLLLVAAFIIFILLLTLARPNRGR